MALEHKIRTPKGAIIGSAKNRFTAAEFVRELSNVEFRKLVSGRKTNDDIGVMLERIKITGLDFNDTRDIDLINSMMAAGVLNKARRDALVG